MRDAILVLDDDQSRIHRFMDVLSQRYPRYLVHHWSDAHVMIHDLDRYLRSAALICLDHDLYPIDDNAPDPGTGLDVARRLAQSPPCCPVLIHSSNGDRAAMMLGELQVADWKCGRIAPLGDDWIEFDWATVIAEFLQGN